MRIPFRRSSIVPEVTQPDYEDREGQHDWAGLWHLDRRDMTWHRPEYYYFRSAVTKRVQQNEQEHSGPMVRPGALAEVVQLNVPLAVLRSHPETPGILADRYEGMWIGTNPAWPEMTVDVKLGQLGLKADWGDSPRGLTETIELIPSMSQGLVYPLRIESMNWSRPEHREPITTENSLPFDELPLLLSGVCVYVRGVPKLQEVGL